MAYEVVHHHKKKEAKNIVFINITKLKAGSETSLPGRSVFLWTSHAMLRLHPISLRDKCMTLLWKEKKTVKKTRILQSITWNGSHSRSSDFCENR